MAILSLDNANGPLIKIPTSTLTIIEIKLIRIVFFKKSQNFGSVVQSVRKRNVAIRSVLRPVLRIRIRDPVPF
jgi:hypothetical protein